MRRNTCKHDLRGWTLREAEVRTAPHERPAPRRRIEMGEGRRRRRVRRRSSGRPSRRRLHRSSRPPCARVSRREHRPPRRGAIRRTRDRHEALERTYRNETKPVRAGALRRIEKENVRGRQTRHTDPCRRPRDERSEPSNTDHVSPLLRPRGLAIPHAWLRHPRSANPLAEETHAVDPAAGPSHGRSDRARGTAHLRASAARLARTSAMRSSTGRSPRASRSDASSVPNCAAAPTRSAELSLASATVNTR